MVFIAKKEDVGKTVLSVLRCELGFSRAMIKHLKFLDDGITVDSQRVTVRYVLGEGDKLCLNTEETEDSGIVAKDLPLRIVYEDSQLAVPDKPPFMPTHPSHDHYEDTVANALAYRYRKDGEPFVFRPVNRLDRNTSGLLLVAKNRIAAGKLYRSMKNKEIRKKYIAILDGALSKDEGEIETYIRRTKESIIVREVCEKEDGADYALTRYKVIKRSAENTVVLAEPITGRTHQLRVHFAHLGCPIVGDELYGRESPYIGRHALHSCEMIFTHPENGVLMRFSAPLHEDMKKLASQLFGDEVFEDDFWKEERE